nr:MAG TPA: hypothetical protein [Caudoviricetes sp.]
MQSIPIFAVFLSVAITLIFNITIIECLIVSNYM